MQTDCYASSPPTIKKPSIEDFFYLSSIGKCFYGGIAADCECGKHHLHPYLYTPDGKAIAYARPIARHIPGSCDRPRIVGKKISTEQRILFTLTIPHDVFLPEKIGRVLTAYAWMRQPGQWTAALTLRGIQERATKEPVLGTVRCMGSIYVWTIYGRTWNPQHDPNPTFSNYPLPIAYQPLWEERYTERVPPGIHLIRVHGTTTQISRSLLAGSTQSANGILSHALARDHRISVPAETIIHIGLENALARMQTQKMQSPYAIVIGEKANNDLLIALDTVAQESRYSLFVVYRASRLEHLLPNLPILQGRPAFFDISTDEQGLCFVSPERQFGYSFAREQFCPLTVSSPSSDA